MNYERDMQIDPASLDVEWLDQPSLMMKYSRHQAQMQKEEDQAKENLELVEAELDLEIRNNPAEFDLPKVTEGAVKSTILQQKRYQTALAEYNEIKFENKVAKGALSSVDHRKSSLENLVKLHGQQYFAGPNVPRDLSKEWEEREHQKKSNKTVTMKRRK